jgi:hypothetical protein
MRFGKMNSYVLFPWYFMGRFYPSTYSMGRKMTVRSVYLGVRRSLSFIY